MDFKTNLQPLKPSDSYQFALFRIALGCYLIVHFAELLPYSTEIWSNIGLLPQASLNLTHGYFPNILNVFDAPAAIHAFLLFLLAAAILFLLGIQRRIASFALWYGWVCLFDRNNLINNPGIPFVGWILLCCAAIPKGEVWALFSPQKTDWTFPKPLFIGAWAIMAIGYTISGFDKFSSPSWYDGTAIIHLLNNPLARDWGLRTFLLSLPTTFLHGMTWTILFIEMAFLPLALWSKTRKWIWLLMILMHVGILFIIDFADLTIGMLFIHAFTFDSRWLNKRKHV
jgi:hypothetical protein